MIKRIWILTLFPDYFAPLLEWGIIGKVMSGERSIRPYEKVEVKTVLLSDHSPKGYKGVDEAPYGGGPGMVMRADVLKNALLEGVVKAGEYGENWREKLHVVYPSPRGRLWNHQTCRDFAQKLWAPYSPDLVFICGRYEGIDERFVELYVNEEICLGDYILTGAEIPVMAILDSTFRFLEGALGNEQSLQVESFTEGLLEQPHYTRPKVFDGLEVPAVLLGGHHAQIEQWKKQTSLQITQKYRPDLYEKFKQSQKGKT